MALLLEGHQMPLLDHFHPPLSRTHPWRSFHGTWAATIARLLNAGVLPEGYYAVPFLDRDGPIEIDVATVAQNGVPTPNVVHVWAPSQPATAVAVEWPTSDDVSVEVYADHGDPRLAATIELVSPQNKDRPRSRQAFVSKCTGHLRAGRGVVVVDAVTTRRAELHIELLDALAVERAASAPPSLSAVSYRALGREEKGQLQFWQEPLAVGSPLPTVPLWLNGEFPVPLDLEASHTAACKDLRIQQAE